MRCENYQMVDKVPHAMASQIRITHAKQHHLFIYLFIYDLFIYLLQYIDAGS